MGFQQPILVFSKMPVRLQRASMARYRLYNWSIGVITTISGIFEPRCTNSGVYWSRRH
ncbi:uncharacterized protein G2W53_039365 [Senna tora]|uniref:Uncharacterized protein n=1 Tax=Senna tora TaxID=362788 RepID=A0A834SNH1_9FABA|nr:uncharacterized protein G2W53_039365 [Senna tora]